MAYPAYVRERARQLRSERKLTIDELAERLALPRTTVYRWVRDLPISHTEARTLASRRAGEVTKAIHQRRRAAAYERGKLEFPELLKESTFRDFICMYIGEGSKRARNVVAICNSDPAVVRLGSIWIRRLAPNPSQIKFQRKSNSGQLSGRIWSSQYGVLQVRTPDTYLRARLQAWMDCVRAEWP